MTLACTKMFLESDRKQQPRVISLFYSFHPIGVFFYARAVIDKRCWADIMGLLFQAREKRTKDDRSQRLGKASGTEDG